MHLRIPSLRPPFPKAILAQKDDRTSYFNIELDSHSPKILHWDSIRGTLVPLLCRFSCRKTSIFLFSFYYFLLLQPVNLQRIERILMCHNLVEYGYPIFISN